MTTVGVFEAKNRLSELLERAAQGEEFVITRRGEPLARIVPPAVADAREDARRLVAQIRRARAGRARRGDGASLRTMIEDGRR